MSKSNDSTQVAGRWKRWSRYELVDRIIAPVQDATLEEWDPWEMFRANAGKYRTVEQPYLALMELRRTLKDRMDLLGAPQAGYLGRKESGRPADRAALAEVSESTTAGAHAIILEWCQAHGLLGIVPVLCSRFRLRGEVRRREEPNSFGIDWVQYFREGGGWQTHRDVEGRSGPDAEKTAHALVSAKNGTVTWIHPLTHARFDGSLADLTDFFPRVAANFIPPQPLGEQFWGHYGEPVPQFAKYCDEFARSVDLMSHWPGEEIPERDPSSVKRAFKFLSGLTLAAGRSFLHDTASNRTISGTHSAGLLASYALMFLLDHEVGRRCRPCENCDRHYVSNERRARYCSTRCRNTAQSRRQRRKAKGANV